MKVAKKEQWDSKLYEFINDSRDKPFKWGKWDCCIFGIDAIKAMTGDLPLKSHWKNKNEAMEFIATEVSLNKIMTKYLREWGLDIIDKMFITAGDIALVKDENGEELVGVCTGNMIACVCEDGFTFKGNLTAKKVWRIRNG